MLILDPVLHISYHSLDFFPRLSSSIRTKKNSNKDVRYQKLVWMNEHCTGKKFYEMIHTCDISYFWKRTKSVFSLCCRPLSGFFRWNHLVKLALKKDIKHELRYVLAQKYRTVVDFLFRHCFFSCRCENETDTILGRAYFKSNTSHMQMMTAIFSHTWKASNI